MNKRRRRKTESSEQSNLTLEKKQQQKWSGVEWSGVQRRKKKKVDAYIRVKSNKSKAK